jgi:predicted DCC family thiol-disulfide oxidoreductase YuxK
MSERDRAHPIVVFDGACNLCNASVDFIIDRDPQAHFRFVARQSEPGRRLLRAHGLPEAGVGSLVVIDGDRVLVRSSAALAIAQRLSGAWPLVSVFRLVPGPLRDAAYGLVARNRTRLFGAREVCAIPTPERAARFLSA